MQTDVCNSLCKDFKRVGCEFENYLFYGGFPYIDCNDADFIEVKKINQIINTIMSDDMGVVFSQKHIDKLKYLYVYICGNSADIFSNLEFLITNKGYRKKYIDYLVDNNLVYKVMSFDNNRHYKLYLTSNSIQQAVLCYCKDSITMNKQMQVETTIYHNLLKLNRSLNIKIKSQIIKNTKAMIAHKIGSMVVFSSSNLILSKFIGLSAVGLYSNYYMVISVLNSFAGKFFGAITASVGNLMVLEENSKKIKAFKITEFITALQAAICFCGLYVLFNPFVELWVGKAYLFDEVIVAAMAFSFYLMYMRKAVLMFRDACGLYWNDRYKPLAESIINLTASIYLTIHYGVIGVVVGGIISTLLTCFWVEPYVLFNNGIDIKLKDYFIDYLKFTVAALLSAMISGFVYSSLFVKVTLINFIAGIFICVSITLIIWYVVFRNREELQYLINFAKSKFAK